MRLVYLQTKDGADLFVNPEKVAYLYESKGGVSLRMEDGDEWMLATPLKSVVHILIYGPDGSDTLKS